MKYITKGTCSREINFEVVDGKLHNVSYLGGCNGNLKGVGALVEGISAKLYLNSKASNAVLSKHPVPTSWLWHWKSTYRIIKSLPSLYLFGAAVYVNDTTEQ